MKKLFSVLSIVLALLAAPVLVFATTLSQDVTIILPSDSSQYTMVSGGTFDTLTINGSTFVFDMSAGQSVVVTSSGLKNLVNTLNSPISCTSNLSTVSLSVSSSQAVTLTPSGACTPADSSGGSSNTVSSGGGGGGGGGSSGSTASPTPSPSVTPTPSATPTSSTSPSTSPSSGPAASPTPTITPYVSPPGLSGPARPPAVPPPWSQSALFKPKLGMLVRNLAKGSRGDDVHALQEYLASDPAIYPEGNTSGYFGELTQLAIQRFQEKYGIAGPGEPGFGSVGPKTRAKLHELDSGAATSFPQDPADLPPTGSGAAVILTGVLVMGSKGDDVTALQAFLARYPDVYPEGKISGYFGALTRKAVQLFQQKYSLAAVGNTGYGVVGPATRAKIKEISSGQGGGSVMQSPPVISGGSMSVVQAMLEQIRLLQEQINNLRGR